MEKASLISLFLTRLCIEEIARSLNIQNDPHPHTPSPTTALFLKRKFEQESDDESEDDEDYEDEVEDEEEVEEEYEEDEEDESEIRGKSEPPAIGGAKGKHVYVDETVLARDGLIDGSFGGGMMMSGALQDPEVA